jgi:Ca2+-binding EF-hand superfamily protein
MSRIVIHAALAGALLAVGSLPGTAQDTERAAEVFKMLDNNKDGKLSQGEFYRLYEMEGKTTSTSEQKEKEFKSWDTDNDGYISQAEFDAKFGG